MSPLIPARYRIKGALGQGGSGRVLHVLDSATHLNLALKIVSPTESAWLRREFETLRKIRHENLIQVFDWGYMPNGESYYTMELIEGGEWGRRMDEPQASEEVRRILAGILRGLAHLHSHGEIHGDLKPGNVLLGVTSVRISDVGMGGSAGTTSLSGTPGYAAPEIWEGAIPSVQTDLYSVGAMAYEALAGRHPFAGKTVREVVSGQLAGWVPSLAALGIVVPVELEQAIMRSLERNPSLREADADEFLEILDVEDRVGEILGGKFVDREAEMDLAEEILSPKSAAAPSVLYIGGAPGTGKTALIEELLDRAVAGGTSITRTRSSAFSDLRGERKVPATAPDSAATDLGISVVARGLWEGARSAPTALCIELRSASARDIDRIRSLGRYLSEYAREAGEPCRVRVVAEIGVPLPTTEEFERLIVLEPFPERETGLLVEGLLGRSQLESGVMDWLQSSTGGVPVHLVSAIAELIDQGLLTRRNGSWSFRETGLLREFRPREASRWGIAWAHLTARARETMIVLSLSEGGLEPSALKLTLGSATDALQDLKAKGWVIYRDEKWRVVSEDVRRSVEQLADVAVTSRLRKTFLHKCGELLTREERAVLLLGTGASGEAIDEGVWASELASSRGDFGTAVERASAALKLALQGDDHSRARKASILLASAMHHGGDDEGAAKRLQDSGVWDSPEINTGEAAARMRIMGMVQRALGNLDESREYLRNAVRVSESIADTGGFLQSTAELAEIEWRYGDAAKRGEAIETMRAALAQSSNRNDLEEERAALAYQLGAAMVVDGRRDEAQKILLEGLKLRSSPFWKMRMSNALAIAYYYLGEFSKGLGELDKAWHCAEEGGIDSFRARILSNRAGNFYGLGRFRDAVDQNELSGIWARRTGNAFEYLAACSGQSISLILLARYEPAIVQAQEARKVAERLDGHYEIAKNYELESLARYLMGDYETGKDLLKRAEDTIEHFGLSEVKPRLLWHRARFMELEGNVKAAEQLLLEADSILRDTKDWEDSPGVQIELSSVRFRNGQPAEELSNVRALTREAEHSGAMIVMLRGALAIAEMVVALGSCNSGDRDLIVRGFGAAEQAGARELGWQLSYLLGELSAAQGDARVASSRFAHAARGLREVAGDLSPEHRNFYLRTAHARALLARVS